MQSLVHPLTIVFMIATLAAVVPRSLGDDWICVGGDRGCTRHSALSQINRNNVGNLDVAWVYHTGELDRARQKIIECTPVVVENLMYITTGHLRVAMTVDDDAFADALTRLVRFAERQAHAA